MPEKQPFHLEVHAAATDIKQSYRGFRAIEHTSAIVSVSVEPNSALIGIGDTMITLSTPVLRAMLREAQRKGISWE